MADTLTNNYSLVQPQVGGDLDAWGGILNNGTIAATDAALAGVLPVTITGTDVTLTTTPPQFQNAIFVITGALTGGNRKFIIPFGPNTPTVACAGRFVVVNNTTGAFNLTVLTQASGSVGVVVPQGFAAFLYSDGTNVGFATNGLGAFAQASNGNPNGQLAGTAGSVNTNASIAYDYTNAVFYICTTTGNAAGAVWSQPNVVVTRGFDTVVNLGLSVTNIGGNLLQIAVLTAAGANPTPSSPVVVNFQTISALQPTGQPTSISITSPLSINTITTGQTFGVGANVPFRLWIALFNASGTPIIAVGCFSGAGQVFPVNESGVATTFNLGGGGTSRAVWYSNAVTTGAYRLIGYCDFANGLATPGAFTIAPSNVVLFGPGIRKPGDVVQSAYNSASTSTNGLGNSWKACAPTISIAPTSTINLIRVRANGTLYTGAPSGVFSFQAQLSRAGGFVGIGNTAQYYTGSSGVGTWPTTLEAIEVAGTTSIITYQPFIGSGNAQIPIWNSGGSNIITPVSNIFADEIMG